VHALRANTDETHSKTTRLMARAAKEKPPRPTEILSLVDRLAARCESKAFSNHPEVRRDMAAAVHLLQQLLATGAMFEESAHTAIANFRSKDDEVPNVAASVAQLISLLSRINEARERHPDMRRRTAMYAISAVIEFLVRIDKKRASIAALGDLRSALLDLDRGVPPEIFELEGKGSRPPDSTDRVMMKGIAAAAMSAMIDAGLSRADAAQRVANELRRCGIKLGGSRHLNGGIVASWRDQTRAAKDGSDLANVYRLCMEGGRLLGPMSPPIHPSLKLDAQQREHYCRGVLRRLSKSLSYLIPNPK
jgi:hypothetical protein